MSIPALTRWPRYHPAMACRGAGAADHPARCQEAAAGDHRCLRGRRQASRRNLLGPALRRPPRTGAAFRRQREAQAEEALVRAVRRRMVGDAGRRAASGGVDSSPIVGPACRAGQQGLNTFDRLPRSGQRRMRRRVPLPDIIAREFGTQHHRIAISNSKCHRTAGHHCRHVGADGHMTTSAYLLSREVSARQGGADGQGADEVFAGYHWYPPLADSQSPVDDYAWSSSTAALRIRAQTVRDPGRLATPAAISLPAILPSPRQRRSTRRCASTTINASVTTRSNAWTVRPWSGTDPRASSTTNWSGCRLPPDKPRDGGKGPAGHRPPPCTARSDRPAQRLFPVPGLKLSGRRHAGPGRRHPAQRPGILGAASTARPTSIACRRAAASTTSRRCAVPSCGRWHCSNCGAQGI